MDSPEQDNLNSRILILNVTARNGSSVVVLWSTEVCYECVRVEFTSFIMWQVVLCVCIALGCAQVLPAPVGLRVEMLLETAAPTLVVSTATPRFSFVSAITIFISGSSSPCVHRVAAMHNSRLICVMADEEVSCFECSYTFFVARLIAIQHLRHTTSATNFWQHC